VRNEKVLAPEYAGDGKTVGRCADRELPIADFPAHWAPLGMTFYTGSAFGNKYEGGLFIAFHGSRFDPRFQPAGPGYNVVFVNWQNGKPAGRRETMTRHIRLLLKSERRACYTAIYYCATIISCCIT